MSLARTRAAVVAVVDVVRDSDRHRTRFRASINLALYDKVYRASLSGVGMRRVEHSRGGCGVKTSSGSEAGVLERGLLWRTANIDGRYVLSWPTLELQSGLIYYPSSSRLPVSDSR